MKQCSKEEEEKKHFRKVGLAGELLLIVWIYRVGMGNGIGFSSNDPKIVFLKAFYCQDLGNGIGPKIVFLKKKNQNREEEEGSKEEEEFKGKEEEVAASTGKTKGDQSRSLQEKQCHLEHHLLHLLESSPHKTISFLETLEFNNQGVDMDKTWMSKSRVSSEYHQGKSKTFTLNPIEWKQAHRYMLFNSEALDYYIEEHKRELKRKHRRISAYDLDKLHHQQFDEWIFHKCQNTNDSSLSDEVIIDDSAAEVDSTSYDFWVLVAALKKHGVLKAACSFGHGAFETLEFNNQGVDMDKTWMSKSSNKVNHDLSREFDWNERI
ncbi:hypothetical protein J5N97_024957 [Dioscorea zingiberensis]|uniref:Uncharacterized protein n=1 Tax=Dioscorea zingiberensis TaxID=325984 RepID=A0A9D5H9F2_9LILI|nr:hypothetical protein J5N97_024957 [Dioscorea zingiberensis]